MSLRLAPLLATSLVACTGSNGGGKTGADSGFSAESPCASGDWEYISDPAIAVHVRAEGDDEAGDGSADAPLATLQAALDLVRESEDDKAIAIGPGDFDAQIDLAGEGILSDDFQDDGTIIQGCGYGETALVGSDDDSPLIRITSAQNIALEGLAMRGGRRSLWIWAGAAVTVDGMTISETSKVGVVVDGPATTVSLSDVHVSDIDAESTDLGSEIGYGISIEEAAVSITNSSVTGATSVGILSNKASLSLDTVTVSETAKNSSDLLGRGIQLQGGSEATLMDCTLVSNSDAALFSLQSYTLEIDGLAVEEVGWAEIPDSSTGETSGDGVVVSGADNEGDHNYDPETFQTTLTNSVISDTARAGVILEHVAADVSANELMDCTLASDDGVSMFYQDSASVSGDDELVELAEGGVMEPLSLYRDSVEMDLLDN